MFISALRYVFSGRSKTVARLNHLLYAQAKLVPELPPMCFVDGHAVALCDGGIDGGCYAQIGSLVFVHGAEPLEAIENCLPLLMPSASEHKSSVSAA